MKSIENLAQMENIGKHGRTLNYLNFSPSWKSSEKGLRTRFAITLGMQGWSHRPLTARTKLSAWSSLKNLKIGEVCEVCRGSWVVRLRGSSIDQSVAECQTSAVCTFLSTPGGPRGTIGADTDLPTPAFFLGSCTCRARIALHSELRAAGRLANAWPHWKVFQERQSLDQIELQHLFLLDVYSLSVHALETPFGTPASLNTQKCLRHIPSSVVTSEHLIGLS